MGYGSEDPDPKVVDHISSLYIAMDKDWAGVFVTLQAGNVFTEISFTFAGSRFQALV